MDFASSASGASRASVSSTVSRVMAPSAACSAARLSMVVRRSASCVRPDAREAAAAYSSSESIRSAQYPFVSFLRVSRCEIMSFIGPECAAVILKRSSTRPPRGHYAVANPERARRYASRVTIPTIRPSSTMGRS